MPSQLTKSAGIRRLVDFKTIRRDNSSSSAGCAFKKILTRVNPNNIDLQGVGMSGFSSKTLVCFNDNHAALINPGMGWQFHYYDDSIFYYGCRLTAEDTIDQFPGLSVLYMRLAWSFLEPEEGQFNWNIVDGPAQRFIDAGRKIAFRFTCCESGPTFFATPQWVKDAGAKGNWFTRAERPGSQYWEPDYNDPVFLKYLDRFLAAAAHRYDGNPNVAFIDIGSYGIWGEGHTFQSTKLPATVEIFQNHLLLHQRNFKKTILAINDDFFTSTFADRQVLLDEAAKWAKVENFTLRDDSIMFRGGPGAYRSADIAQLFWPVAPVILECDHYGPSKERGAWEDGSKYIEAMEAYHASYASIHWWPGEFLEECRPLIDKMNRRLGYRLVPHELCWTGTVTPGGRITFGGKWSNTGVAPCYCGGYPAWTFKTPAGGIAWTFVDGDFNVRDLPVGPDGRPTVVQRQADFFVPTIAKGGEYDVFISVGSADGSPQIALPLDGNDGARRYRAGRIRIEE